MELITAAQAAILAYAGEGSANKTKLKEISESITKSALRGKTEITLDEDINWEIEMILGFMGYDVNVYHGEEKYTQISWCKYTKPHIHYF